MEGLHAIISNTNFGSIATSQLISSKYDCVVDLDKKIQARRTPNSNIKFKHQRQISFQAVLSAITEIQQYF
jgi:hypothetical protein